MATVTATPDLQKFPVGTAVSLYLRTSDEFDSARKGSAQGNSPQTIASDGTVSFTGLTANASYWLAASVSSVWQHEAVTADAAPATAGDVTGDLDVGGDLTVAGGLGVNGSSAPAQAAAIATPASPGASYVQAEVVALRTAISSILVALRNTGIIDT